jgi:outer membrane cobalamin receptor
MRNQVTDDLNLTLSVFRNDLKDAFDFMMDPDGVFRNRNVTRLQTTGVETELRYRLTRTLTALANYSYTDGTYREALADPTIEGNQLAYLAPNKGALGLDYAAARAGAHSVLLRYVGSRYGDAQNTPQNKMDDYAVVDWRSRVPVWGNWQATLNVDNVLNSGYRDVPQYLQPGRAIMLGVETLF